MISKEIKQPLLSSYNDNGSSLSGLTTKSTPSTQFTSNLSKGILKHKQNKLSDSPISVHTKSLDLDNNYKDKIVHYELNEYPMVQPQEQTETNDEDKYDGYNAPDIVGAINKSFSVKNQENIGDDIASMTMMDSPKQHKNLNLIHRHYTIQLCLGLIRYD